MEIGSDAPIRDAFSNKIKRILTGTSLFIISYLSAWAVQQYTTSGLLLLFDYHPVISFNDNADLPFDYRQWSLARINVIFSCGSLFCLLLGLITYMTLDEIPYTTFKMFAVLITICFINLFLGYILFSPFGIDQFNSPLYKGYAIIGSWWRMGEVVFVALAIISFFSSIIFGFIIRDELLKFSFSSRMNRAVSGKKSLIIQFYILPIIISAPFILFLTTHRSFLIHCFLFVNLFLIAIGMLLKNEYGSKIVLARKEDIMNKLPFSELLFAAIIYAVVFFVLR
jgi:hypothetical protein